MGFLFDYTPEELATFTLEELEILQEADDFFSRADAIERKKLTLAAMERTNILQEEEDKNLSLGMPVQPQEDDEQLENEERKLPPSPPMDEGNTQTQKPFVGKLIDNNEECCLNMLYDNALDDGPMLIDNPPCLELVTTLCEDKNDILAACDNTFTHESPTLFLNSPIHTVEEKLLWVEKYLCGLKLSYTNNHFTHNHHYNHHIYEAYHNHNKLYPQ